MMNTQTTHRTKRVEIPEELVSHVELLMENYDLTRILPIQEQSYAFNILASRIISLYQEVGRPIPAEVADATQRLSRNIALFEEKC